MDRRASELATGCEATRPELLIPAKNDKADKFAAEQGESHQSCKMPWKVILATFLLEMQLYSYVGITQSKIHYDHKISKS